MPTSTKCEKCGKDDPMILITKYKVCGSCTRKAHTKATGKEKVK